MGVLLPMTGYWPIGTRIAGSIPLAVHDIINSPSLLPGYNISFRIHNSGCLAEKGIQGMVDYREMDIIIGPACSTVAEPVALLSKIWDKPIVTYAASATKFTDKNMYSTFSLITAYGRRNVEYTTTVLGRLMRVFNWTVCGIISSSEVEWKNLATVLRGALVKAKTRIPLFENYYKEMKKQPLLEKAKERVRVILLLAYIKDITEFMTIAKRLGMTDGSYAFITVDLNTDVFYANGKWTGHEGPGTQFDEVLNGILDLSVQRPILTKSFMDRYRGELHYLPKEIQIQLIPNISWYAAFLYDSIWLAGRALDATIKQGYNITNTSVVVDKMFNINFTGERFRNLMDSVETFSSISKDADRLSVGNTSRPKFNVALYQGKKVYVKRLHHDAINVTREVKTEIRQACELRHVNINPYLGLCIDPLDVCVISEHCTKGRLQDILFDENLNLDWNFKMSFVMDIARGMEELHKSSIGYHGSLKSRNIVVDSYWICKVADFGLSSLKSSGNQASLFDEANDEAKYSDLLWTAPEKLRLTAYLEQTQAGDVYSYGIVLQEIVLREKPYSISLLGPKEIIHHVKKGIRPHCRPNVPPDSAPAAFRDLMTMSWDETPERRPTFSGVLKMLKKINKGKAINIVDNMLTMMGKYTNNLESLVKERTRQLETEKAKTDELLYRMMPRSIADKLKAGLYMRAEIYDHVTIFFSEIVDFTGIVDQSTPTQFINLLNDLYSLYDTVIARYDVFKVMTVCDSYMVVSGLPERNGKQHAAEIASLSLHLLFYFKDFKIQHLPNEKLMFKMGIHTAQHIHMSEKCKSFLEELGGFTYEKREDTFVK
ncbi:hypothetical protein QZH41_019299, partial [Actinostola sp. cb2023]